jgi:teichuronic acid biosynthesis glycosyltransferase TuaC
MSSDKIEPELHLKVSSRLRILTLSRNYPNSVFPSLGLWVQRQVHQLAHDCEMVVVSPIPYYPALMPNSYYSRFRIVERYRKENNVHVWHPRLLLAPGYAFQSLEAGSYYLATRRLCDRLWRDFQFDLIHAHFSYPDGVVAAMLGHRYQVPVVVTEHAFWRPWLEQFPTVRSQTLWASRKTDVQIAVSRALRETIASFTGDPDRIRVIPNGVDGSLFTLADPPSSDSNQILFVGHLNFVKGVDVLLHAFANLLKTRPDLRLVMVGGASYRDTQVQAADLRNLAYKLALIDKVDFVGIKPPNEVARYMRESALLVLPSRRETFGSVLIEALACGIPVVATRCGGTEDIVTPEVGVLVRSEDASSLAQGIDQVLANRSSYRPEVLRNLVLRDFSLERVAHKTIHIYSALMDRAKQPA